MNITVTKQFTFDSAHFLTDYEGACSRMHGHTYKLEVTVGGGAIKKTGMVIDFKELKEAVNELIIDVLDHQVLNEVVECKTTAENLAVWIFSNLKGYLYDPYTIEKVRLWETPTSYAEVTK